MDTLLVKSKLMRTMVERIIERTIKKKLNIDIRINVEDLEIVTQDDGYTGKIDASFDIGKNDVYNIISKI